MACISRNENTRLIDLAKNNGVSLEYIRFDLLDVNRIRGIMEDIFLQIKTEEIKTDKRIINISSGAGKKPYFGWSNYCSAKAGMDIFTRCVGLEQVDKDYPVKSISFAPGIIDTEMQSEIRASNKENFKDLERFFSLKEEGKLLSPDEVSKYVLKLLELEYEGGEVIDIKQFQ